MWKCKKVMAGVIAVTLFLNMLVLKSYADIEGQGVFSEENLVKVKETQGIKNTIWAEGVNIDNSDFHLFRDGDTAEYFVTKHGAGSGWYDINKNFDMKDGVLCAGAVATNMFHWWLDINKDYVDRYLAEDINNASITISDRTVDLRELKEVYENEGYRDKSKFFDFIKQTFSGAVWVDKILDLYINGYSYSRRYAKNIKGVDKASSSVNFFNKVFSDNLLTNVYDNITDIEEFSNIVKSELESGKVLGLGYIGGIVVGHAVTLWGADFDENDKLVAVYISDSDDGGLKYDNSCIGLKRFKVSQVGDSVKISGYKEADVGSKIFMVYSLMSGKEYWEKYFKKVDIGENNKKENIEENDIKNNKENIEEKDIKNNKKENIKEDNKKEDALPKEEKNKGEIYTSNKKDKEIVQKTNTSGASFYSGGGGSSSSGKNFKTLLKRDYKENINSLYHGMWKQDNKGWWYQNEDKSYPRSSFKSLLWNGRYSWYYFNSEGYIVSGWQSINGKWYYFYPKTEGINIYGSMAKNTVIDGYFIGENGAVNR